MNILYETERLIIRKWENKDYKDLYEYASDENVTKFLSWPTYVSLDDAVSRINFVKQQYLPDILVGSKYYEPKENSKFEKGLKERYDFIESLKK